MPLAKHNTLQWRYCACPTGFLLHLPELRRLGREFALPPAGAEQRAANSYRGFSRMIFIRRSSSDSSMPMADSKSDSDRTWVTSGLSFRTPRATRSIEAGKSSLFAARVFRIL